MQLRKWLPVSLMLAVGGCSGTIGDGGAESTAELRKLPATGGGFTEFETLQVRPLALSPNGKTLFATNTPDNRLEMFHVIGAKLSPFGSVVVGLEPVAVAARNENEVWVVNHLSDSVSIVHVTRRRRGAPCRARCSSATSRATSSSPARNRSRAFITTAHRGQNTGDGYDLQTAGVGRADVWVFDADHLGATAGGTRLAKLTFFADTPRALAVSPDGKTVYAAAFNSGNQTTTRASRGAVGRLTADGDARPGDHHAAVGVGPCHPAAADRPHRQVRKGGHWHDAYGAGSYDPLSRSSCPTWTCSPSTRSGSSRREGQRHLRARRHHAVQHGGQPEDGRSTSPTPTRTTTSASRATRPASPRSPAT